MFHLFFKEEEYHKKPLPIEPCCVGWPCFCSRFPGSALNEFFEPPSSLEVMPRESRCPKKLARRDCSQKMFCLWKQSQGGSYKCWISSISSDAEVNDIHLYAKFEDFSYCELWKNHPESETICKGQVCFQSRYRPTQTPNQQLNGLYHRCSLFILDNVEKTIVESLKGRLASLPQSMVLKSDPSRLGCKHLIISGCMVQVPASRVTNMDESLLMLEMLK